MSVQGHHFVRNTETGKDLVPMNAASSRRKHQGYKSSGTARGAPQADAVEPHFILYQRSLPQRHQGQILSQDLLRSESLQI